MITIFSTNPPGAARRCSAAAASLMLHSVGLLVVAAAARYSHADFSHRTARRYPVRFIHLQLSEPVATQASRTTELTAASTPARHGSLLQHHLWAKQTLIRPDVPPDVLINQEIPLPVVMPWSENSLPTVPEFVTLPKEAPILPTPLWSRLSLDLPSARADVISLPNLPSRVQNLLVVPPANQITFDDGAGADPRSAGSGLKAGLVRITQPKDGKFGIVVSGSSASDLLPDSAGTLTGKIVYTVYLRVGLRKNWILQYCLPQGVEPGSAAVDAPWPFLMMRPEQLSAADPDYIVIRGVINCSGRFEQLGLVYPSELDDQQKLLGALRQWTFRPAKRDGQEIAVEALLVIPSEVE